MDETVLELLRTRITSLEQLEALLLLERERDRDWVAEELAMRIRIPPGVADEALEHLARNELLHVGSRGGRNAYRYGPRSVDIAASVDLLSRTFEVSRIEIVKLMNANAIDRVRTRALRTFSDAFLLRRKKDG